MEFSKRMESSGGTGMLSDAMPAIALKMSRSISSSGGNDGVDANSRDSSSICIGVAVPS